LKELSVFTLLFRNGKEYCFTNAWINRGTEAFTSCKNVVKISSVTSDFKKGVCGIFAITGQKLAYPTEYLSSYWTDLYRTVIIVDMYVRIIKVALVYD